MSKEKMKFNEFLFMFLKEKEVLHAPSTQVKYIQLVNNHIAPYFSEILLEDITEVHLKKFRNSLYSADSNDQKAKLSQGMISSILMIVNMALKEAFEKNLISYAVHINPGLKKKKAVVQVFSTEDQKILEKYIKKHKNPVTFGIYLSLYTGLRLGELCALKWENLNLDDAYIYVQHTVQRLTFPQKNDNEKKSRLFLTTPKSISSVRLVPIPSFLLPLIKGYAKKSGPRNFILSGKEEIPMEPRTLQYQYKRCLEEAGVHYLNFHSLRHTFATRCITIGIDPKTLSEILGHSDIKITMDYYFHSSFEFKKQQIERLSCFM